MPGRILAYTRSGQHRFFLSLGLSCPARCFGGCAFFLTSNVARRASSMDRIVSSFTGVVSLWCVSVKFEVSGATAQYVVVFVELMSFLKL